MSPILITTSRRPTRRTRTFAKELARVLPNAIKVNRGKANLEDLKEYMILKGFTKLIIINTKKGNPSQLVFYELSYDGLKRSLIFNIRGLSLQVDKKVKTYVKYLDDVVDKTGRDRSLVDFLKRFLSVPIIAVDRDGVTARLEVSRDREDLIVLSFIDTSSRIIYPRIRGYVYEFESEEGL